MIQGVIIIDKPQNMTSFDVVAILRRTLKIKKIGHTGTLDPMATGVLPVCIGNATKLVEDLMDKQKTYACELKLGHATDTLDAWGSITEEKSIPALTAQTVINTVKSFEGDIMQVPPMYSAIKIKGQKLVDLARKGIEVERKPRPVTIYSIDDIVFQADLVSFNVHCSKGTYIRTLCDDIARALGTVGHMTALRRLASKPFDLSKAIPIEGITLELVLENLISVEEALSQFEACYIEVDALTLKKIDNGVKLDLLKFQKTGHETLNKNTVRTDVLYRLYINGSFYGTAIGSEQKLLLKRQFIKDADETLAF